MIFIFEDNIDNFEYLYLVFTAITLHVLNLIVLKNESYRVKND